MLFLKPYRKERFQQFHAQNWLAVYRDKLNKTSIKKA